MNKRLISLVLSLCLLISCVTATSVSASSQTELSASGADYGLAKKCEDGNILQCFNWTLSQIRSELPNIAKAGFTTVQTSPLQSHDGGNGWYWIYQPKGFSIGNEIGSLSDLRTLCTQAHQYGVKIIVDVVANHLAGGNDGSWAGSIDSDMRNSAYFHNQGPCTNYDNRYDVTHKNIGMPDLNSENATVQNKVASMVSSLKSAGVDGIRWDAAKHIGLPSENCQFWPKVTNYGLYNYGEILDAPAGKSSYKVNNALIQEYAQYIAVTDETFSGTITGAIRDKTVVKGTGNWIDRGVSANRVVYWAESHDTYSNEKGWTKNLSENQIDRAYAILGARADSQTMYLSRPFEKNYGSITTARKGSTHFTSKEVAAVNHFHNAMVGTKEALATGSGCYVICREGGAVIVSASGANVDVTVKNADGIVPAGIYTDEVSGASFTVTETEISGRIGSSGIAVIYGEPVTGPRVSASPESSSYKTDTLSVTLSVVNATSASYSLDGGSFVGFTNGQKITIGQGEPYGTVTTLTLKASSGSKTDDKTYTYTKVNPNAAQTIYFDNSSYHWSNVYCYLYGDSGSNAEWPGVAMKKGADNIYTYTVPSNFKYGKVLFTESANATDNRYPANNEPGLDLGGESMIFGQNYSWEVFCGILPTQPTTAPTQIPTQAPTPAPTQAPTQPSTSAPTQASTDPSERVMIGDSDLDGKVTIVDATTIQRHLASIKILSGNALKASDVDADQKVTVVDVTNIQRYLAGMTASEGIGKYTGGSLPATEPPTQAPTSAPTAAPTQAPTPVPTAAPTQVPTQMPTQAPTAAPTQAPTKPSTVVTLNASKTSALPEAWYAWTWGEKDGRWVKGVGSASAVTFSGLDTNVIFVRANPDMSIGWDNGSVWNKTEDLTTHLGGTFTTSGWNSSLMVGSWT